MSIHFRGRPAGATPAGGTYQPHRVWRPSASSRSSTAPAVWTVLAALCIVAILTAGLHVLFH